MSRENPGKQITNSINLHIFVKEALIGIIKGIYEAQQSEDVKTAKAVISPANLNYSETKNALFVVRKKQLDERDDAPRVDLVEFDLLITHQTKEEESIDGKIGASIQVLQASLIPKKSEEDLMSSANRLRFSVPVLYPSEYYEFQDDKTRK